MAPLPTTTPPAIHMPPHAATSQPQPPRAAQELPPAGAGRAVGTEAGTGRRTGEPQHGLHRRKPVPALRLLAARHAAAGCHGCRGPVHSAHRAQQQRHASCTTGDLRISPVAGKHRTDHRQPGERGWLHDAGHAATGCEDHQRCAPRRRAGRGDREAICRGHAACAFERSEPAASAGAARHTRGRDEYRHHRLQPVQRRRLRSDRHSGQRTLRRR